MADTQLARIAVEGSALAMKKSVGGWYRSPVKVDIEVVASAGLSSIIDTIDRVRLHASEEVLDAYRANALRPFGPVREGKQPHLGLLLEQSGPHLVILDGVHRARAAQLARVDHLFATIIRPATAPPFAAELVKLADVRVSDQPLAPKFAASRPKEFRPAQAWVAAWQRSIEEIR